MIGKIWGCQSCQLCQSSYEPAPTAPNFVPAVFGQLSGQYPAGHFYGAGLVFSLFHPQSDKEGLHFYNRPAYFVADLGADAAKCLAGDS